MRSFFLARYLKYRKHLTNITLATAAAAGLAASSAQATPINIVNPGFETNDGTGPGSYGFLTGANNPGGWVSGGNAGYMTFGRERSGTYAGYLFSGTTLTEVIAGSNLDAGTYTLSGYGRIANSSGGDVTIAILDGNTLLGSQQTTGLSDAGHISLNPLVLNLAVTINSPITIRITGGAFQQTDVDDFSLDFVPIPEPNSLILMSLSSIGMIRLVRRRRK